MKPVLRILNKETVWMILEELSKGPKTPTELAKKFDMSIANINNFISRLHNRFRAQYGSGRDRVSCANGE